MVSGAIQKAEDQVEKISGEELEKNLQRIKLGKTTGLDEIDPKMMK